MTTNDAKTLSPLPRITAGANINAIKQLEVQADVYAKEKFYSEAARICIEIADQLFDLNKVKYLPVIIKKMICAGDYMVAGKDLDSAKLCYKKSDEYLEYLSPITANDNGYLNLSETLSRRLLDLENISRERKRKDLSLQMAKKVSDIGAINKFEAVHYLARIIRGKMSENPGLAHAIPLGQQVVASLSLGPK